MLNTLRKSLVSAGLLFVLVTTLAQAVTPDELFEVLQRIESLENEVRFLRGENEQLRYDIEDAKSIQKAAFIRLDDRMDDLVRSIRPSASGVRAPAPTVSNSPFVPAVIKPTQPLATPALLKVSAPVSPKPTIKVVKVEEKKKVPPTEPKKLVVKNTAPLPVVKISPVKIKPVKPADPAEQREYNVAFANVKTKPSHAIRQFRDFVSKYPKSPLAANAQYWLGEVMYSSKNYRGAIDEFVVVLEQYSDSSKAPDAAIKLGYSFYEMKNWVYARRTLQDVVRNFPKTSAAKLAEVRLAKMKKDNLY